eukprot:scaffold295674_cov21-Tisochrysis_lutea.AAC.1
MIRPLGPGMVQQIQQRCSNCSGSGSMVPPSDVCGTCKGKGLVAEKKTFEVTIEPGMKQVFVDGAESLPVSSLEGAGQPAGVG